MGILQGASFPELLDLFYSEWATCTYLAQFAIFRAYPHLKPHIVFYSTRSSGLTIWHGLPVIRHITINDGR